jgi:hypothetical protein
MVPIRSLQRKWSVVNTAPDALAYTFVYNFFILLCKWVFQ